MFDTLIFEPIFNVLTGIYAIVPGHNFGLAIILFTILIRILLWPLVKKQLYHAKAIKALQPEVKRIKKEAKGDKQKESQLVMALYKQNQINPFAPIGILLIQLPILLALYAGLRRIINDPQAIIDNSYSFIQNLPSMKELAADITKFDSTLFGFLDLKRSATGGEAVYMPALILAAGSAVMQYYRTKQMSFSSKDSKTIRQIMRESASGTQVDQSEMSAAVSRSTRFFFPALLFLITIGISSGLSLYIFVSGLIAYLQQAYALTKDKEELLGSTVDEVPTASTKTGVKRVKSKVSTKPAKKTTATTKGKK